MMNNKAETPEAAIKEAMQPETPENPSVNRSALLDALVKSNKKVTALEDVLDIFVGAIEDFREAPEEIDRPELAKSTLSYMCGVVDAFKAINGTIIR